MIKKKKRRLEHQEQKSKTMGNIIEYAFPHEFYNSCLMIKTKIIAPYDTQDNNILK